MAQKPKGLTIEVTPWELGLLVEALDSHAYWQLSDPSYRRDGNPSQARRA